MIKQRVRLPTPTLYLAETDGKCYRNNISADHPVQVGVNNSIATPNIVTSGVVPHPNLHALIFSKRLPLPETFKGIDEWKAVFMSEHSSFSKTSACRSFGLSC